MNGMSHVRVVVIFVVVVAVRPFWLLMICAELACQKDVVVVAVAVAVVKL